MWLTQLQQLIQRKSLITGDSVQGTDQSVISIRPYLVGSALIWTLSNCLWQLQTGEAVCGTDQSVSALSLIWWRLHWCEHYPALSLTAPKGNAVSLSKLCGTDQSVISVWYILGRVSVNMHAVKLWLGQLQQLMQRLVAGGVVADAAGGGYLTNGAPPGDSDQTNKRCGNKMKTLLKTTTWEAVGLLPGLGSSFIPVSPNNNKQANRILNICALPACKI